MEITVCFRVVPDISLAGEENWSTNPEICLEGALGRVFDQYDESALEMALRVRDSLADSCTLRALTLEAADTDKRLYERLFALGYDSVERLAPIRDGGLDISPLQKAALLAGHISRGSPPDLILCGIQGGLGGSRITGLAISRFLGLPCLSNVSAIEAGTGLSVSCCDAGTTTSGLLRIPAVLLIGNTENSLLRVPTLKSRLAAGKREAQVWDCPPQTVEQDFKISLSRPVARGQCKFLNPDSAAAAVMEIFAGDGGGEP